MENRMLQDLSRKIGVYDEKIIGLAGEYHRRLEIRSGSGALAGLNLSSSARAVLCLHLAATTQGQPLDMDVSAKMSGLQKKAYLSSLRALESLLQVSSRMTIPDLAVQWGCPSARPLAIQILQRYKDSQAGSGEVEYSDALFNSAALVTACKKMKAKVDRSKVVQTAGVKRGTFDWLVALMEKFGDQVISAQQEAQSTSVTPARSLADTLENMSVMTGAESSRTAHAEEVEEEPYTKWKEHILTQAYQALGKVYSPPVH